MKEYNMARPKKKKVDNFNQYLVDFEFYYLTSISKQKSMLKLQLLCPTKSPDESINYCFSILEQAWSRAFNVAEFNKKVVRFRQISYIPTLDGDLQKNNMGLDDTDKVTNLSTILKKHLIA